MGRQSIFWCPAGLELEGMNLESRYYCNPNQESNGCQRPNTWAKYVDINTLMLPLIFEPCKTCYAGDFDLVACHIRFCNLGSTCIDWLQSQAVIDIIRAFTKLLTNQHYSTFYHAWNFPLHDTEFDTDGHSKIEWANCIETYVPSPNQGALRMVLTQSAHSVEERLPKYSNIPKETFPKVQ